MKHPHKISCTALWNNNLFIPSPCTFHETPPQKICAQISEIPRHFVLPKPTIFQFTYVNPTCPRSLDHPNFSHNSWQSQIKLFFMYPPYSCWKSTGIILCMRPANGRRCYNVTSALIGWVHIQNDPWSMKYANPMCPIINKANLRDLKAATGL